MSGKKLIDLTGQVFGKLTVIERAEDLYGTQTAWYCKCECGMHTVMSSASLRGGLVKSCGCGRGHWRSLIVLDGRRFGKLTVVSELAGQRGKRGERLFRCSCDCGGEKTVSYVSLVNGSTKSCGCGRGHGGLSIILDGRRFGKLTVISEMEQRGKRGARLFRCSCDCGNEKIVSYGNLVNGGTQSCGCLRRDHGRRIGSRGLGKGEAAFNTYVSIAKFGAKKRNIEFSLAPADIRLLTQQDCYYCGANPAQVMKSPGGNGDFVYNGLDRVDNDKGYTLDNVVPCCGQCNLSKRSLSVSEFKEWVDRIHAHFPAC